MKEKLSLRIFIFYAIVFLLCATDAQRGTLNDREHKIGGKNRMENDSSIQSVFNPKTVKKFEFNKWYDKIKVTPVRFYRFFELHNFDANWKLTLKNSENYPMSFVLAETNCWFENMGNNNKKILVTILECESISVAHQLIFSKLQAINRIDPVLDLPYGWEIGDVYKAGYWARGNLFIAVNDLSKSPLDSKELLEINKSIDAQLCKIPTPSTNASNKKIIKSFRCESNIIPPLTLTSLVCELNDIAGDYHYMFIYDGGRISCKNSNFFYTGYESGEHTIEIYITDSKNRTDKNSCLVKVVQ